MAVLTLPFSNSKHTSSPKGLQKLPSNVSLYMLSSYDERTMTVVN